MSQMKALTNELDMLAAEFEKGLDRELTESEQEFVQWIINKQEQEKKRLITA
jgi:hypothetical protein